MEYHEIMVAKISNSRFQNHYYIIIGLKARSKSQDISAWIFYRSQATR